MNDIAVDEDLALLMETLVYTAERAALLAEEIAEAQPLEELAPVLRDFTIVKRHIREAESTIAVAAGKLMSTRYQDVNGIQLERGAASGSDQWDTEGLLSVLLARSRDERIVDEPTGEFEGEGSAFLRVLRECAHIDYFRVGKKELGTGLAGKGVDADEWRVKKSGPRRAKVIDS